MSKKLPIIHALWIGNKLGAISRSCLQSFIMRGHEVHLHTYAEIDDIPEGVKRVDANLIVPSDKIIKHNKTGSYALFSDIFRYELMRKVDGIYVDCDVYCLKPLSVPNHGYVLGFEDDNCINGAVLKIPADSPLLESLLNAAYDPQFVPPWYSKSRQFRLRMKKAFGVGTSIADMPWGVIGPKAITYYIRKHKKVDCVQPIDIFYPVYYQCISQLCDPNLTIQDITTSRTLAVHLYNEMLKGIDLEVLNKNSMLYKFLANEI
ncbi:MULTISPECIES: glycosyltransferase [Acinetobacter]|uniref:glycosyltransferase n=1 Tax=Acinetobacter TaxID=469 RepID=UPI0015D1F044|nr:MULTISPECIES: glycosyltransferase [Acinetobacter]MCA4790176.1 galactosyltransferase Lgt5 [Acinetobacter towneri]MDM1284477.1 galactosyltransferase Lgt5 [Acinetobacter towneri]